MGKKAQTFYEIHPLLVNRWSPRAFSDQPLEMEKIRSLCEAARWSPSGGNQQPWRYIIGLKGDETYRRIFETLDAGNQQWVKNAPLLGITIGRTTLNNSETRLNGNYRYDVGQSIAHLTFEACALGLYVHQMGGLDPEKAREAFEVPPLYEVCTAFVVGYLGDPEILEDEKQRKSELEERTRLSFDEIIFSGKFGQRPDFL
jgi:nitroreductase